MGSGQSAEAWGGGHSHVGPRPSAPTPRRSPQPRSPASTHRLILPPQLPVPTLRPNPRPNPPPQSYAPTVQRAIAGDVLDNVNATAAVIIGRLSQAEVATVGALDSGLTADAKWTQHELSTDSGALGAMLAAAV